MYLSVIIALVAISISIIAAYYSIVGLAAIFAAAIVPIIIMGITLENRQNCDCGMAPYQLETSPQINETISCTGGNHFNVDYQYGYLWILIQSSFRTIKCYK